MTDRDAEGGIPQLPDHSGLIPTAAAELIARLETDRNQTDELNLLLRISESLLGAHPALAETYADRALTLTPTGVGSSTTARALNLIATACWQQGKLARTREVCGQCRKIAAVLPTPMEAQKAALLLGQIERACGNYESAAQILAPAGTAAGDRELSLYAHMECLRAMILSDQGRTEAAEGICLEVLQACEAGDDRPGKSAAFLSLSCIHEAQGDWEEALEYALRALVVNEYAADSHGMTEAHLRVGETYFQWGRPERAIGALEASVTLARSEKILLAETAASGLLGEVCLRSGDLSRARSILDPVVTMARDLGLRREEGVNLRRRAELLLAADEIPEALRTAQEACEVSARVGERCEPGNAQRVLGEVCARNGDALRAVQCFETALERLNVPGHGFELARAQFAFGRWLATNNQRDRALPLLQDAARTWRRAEMYAESEEAERCLTGRQQDGAARLMLLKSLSSLAARAMPVPDFAARAGELLTEAWGLTEAVFYLSDSDRFLGARHSSPPGPDTEGLLRLHANGEMTILPDAGFIPLRRARQPVGVLYVRWPERTAAPGFSEDHAFLETVSNLCSSAVERDLDVQPVSPLSDAPAGPVLRYPGVVGNSGPMQAIYEQVEDVAPTRAPVLITGESGTGKELIARIVRQRSPRAGEAFIAINCAAIPETLLESELFGIEKGTATGVTERPGKFEQVNRGTLFLDEIADMSLPLQAKLLRVVQDQKFERVGGLHTHEVDVRLIAATNRDLDQAIRDGRFREDLYYRLNVVTIALPPLRLRPEDIPLLVDHFLNRYDEEFGRNIRGVGREVMEVLLRYNWPGNVRELENTIERAVILCTSDVIQRRDLPPRLLGAVPEERPASSVEATSAASAEEIRGLRRKLQEDAGSKLEREMALKALEDCRNNVAAASRRIGMSRAQFYRLMRKHGIERK